MNRKDFIQLASGAAAFVVAGCTTEAPVEAVTSATPIVKWKPFPDVKKVRVVQ